MPIDDNVSMFYNAKPHIFEKAKALRKNMTKAEGLLWEQLRGKKMLGFRFWPQHSIDIFIVDFYCHPLKLVIEVDGGIHKTKEQKEYDLGRTAELNHLNIHVIRCINDEIENNLNQVIKKIEAICVERQLKLTPNPFQVI